MLSQCRQNSTTRHTITPIGCRVKHCNILQDSNLPFCFNDLYSIVVCVVPCEAQVIVFVIVGLHLQYVAPQRETPIRDVCVEQQATKQQLINCILSYRSLLHAIVLEQPVINE